MISKYFCAYHVERMRACEYEASDYWAETMRHGMQAYSECRMEVATSYLSAALEVAFLQAGQEKSGFFETVHLTKPAGFLIQLLVFDRRFDDAIVLLSRLSSVEKNGDNSLATDLSAFLTTQYDHVETTEREALTVEKNEKSLSPNTSHGVRCSKFIH